MNTLSVKFILVAHHHRNFPKDGIQLQNNMTAVLKATFFVCVTKHCSMQQYKMHKSHKGDKMTFLGEKGGKTALKGAPQHAIMCRLVLASAQPGRDSSSV